MLQRLFSSESSAEVFAVNTMATTSVHKEATASFAAVQSNPQLESETKDDDVQLIRLASPDDLQLQNIVTPGILVDCSFSASKH